MTKKTGILLTVLIVPVLLYLGLNQFGNNHFQLPRYIPVIDSTTGEVKMAKRKNPRWNETEMDTVFFQIPAFQLIDQKGSVFSSKTLDNQIYVASFFFTRCSTICPKITSQVSRLQDTFSQDDDVKLLSISVDPKFDTPEKLAIYAQRFDAKADKWYFLTGDKKTIYPLALKGFHVPLADASEYDEAIKNPDETFIHSERLILVDKERHIRGFYNGTDKKDVDRLMMEIKVLKRIYESEK
ncbi:SCO family protein [Aquirufa rosea]|uniref:SCO family protein n=1 Tax=Aquirufa rosea TaxID=2509241 RepID=A0A4Q1C1K2_9BACT|nr:SCO family protein [Aquirufa rosea]RXK51027.1 SCO family protein [Aquirufa rosea]